MNHFQLISRPLGSVERFVIHHESNAELEILAGWGAGLNAWRIPTQGKMQELLYGYQTEENFLKTQADTSAGERLSPFPGRTNNAQWTWNGNTYQLDNNVTWAKHAVHGLLHVQPWHFESFESNSKQASLTLSYFWNGAHPGFPFPYMAKSTFIFTGKSFEIRSETENFGKNTMPYAEGWHPYFMLGTKVDNLDLQLPPVHKVLVNESDIPTGERQIDERFTQMAKINDTFINDCEELQNPTPIISADLWNIQTTERIRFWQRTGNKAFNFMQIYTPPDRQSLALEPMTNEPDVLNNHRGLILLKPGEKLNLNWGASYNIE